jgi:serine/threonine protein kinase
MAEVFLARPPRTRLREDPGDQAHLARVARDRVRGALHRRSQAGGELSHTNVVQVFDFGRFAGSPFIAMEYVEGLDLAALLRRLKDRGIKIPMAAAFQIAIELARGLDFAHQHGVVHRDVSPSNILLSKAGEVKIADFGIALAAAPGKVVAGAGRRKVMGKWRYMSPEQARGEPLDTRSDMFSAASVMYELFTGEKLFPGDEAEDIIRNIHSAAAQPGLGAARLPARLDDILHQAPARRAQIAAAAGGRCCGPDRADLRVEHRHHRADAAEAVGYVVDLSTPTGNASTTSSGPARQRRRVVGGPAHRPGRARSGGVGEPTDMPKVIRRRRIG